MTTIQKTTEQIVAEAKAATVLQRNVVLVLNCRSLSNQRRVEPGELRIEKDGEELASEKRSLAMTKRLVNSDKLAACTHAIGAAKAYLRTVATPGLRVFGDRTYLVPVVLASEADARLMAFREELQAAADALADAWGDAETPGTIVYQAKQELGPLFDAHEFPTRGDVRTAFDIDWDYVRFDAPENLVAVDKALAEAADKRFEAKCSAAFDEIVVGLRAGALRVFRELADRLGTGKDGKPKALRATALDDLMAFAALLPKRNTGDDEVLEATVARVAAFSKGLDVDVLRSAPAVRDQVRALAEEAAGAIEGLLQESAGRAIRFRQAS